MQVILTLEQRSARPPGVPKHVCPRGHPWHKVREAEGPWLVKFLPGKLRETAGDTMKETPQEYIKRITSYVEGQQPLKVQAATPRKLERLIKGVSVSKLRKRPAPDKWSVVEILAHLADTEIVGGFRIRMILGAPGTLIEGFNQDAWATSGHYDKRDPRKSVEQFQVFREANLALLKSIMPEQWKHHGVHFERGEETVEHIVRMFAGHDLNHIRQIEGILGPKK
ncbi:MAG: DinB family protein [Candidatus Korobacteraceae bacterium]